MLLQMWEHTPNCTHSFLSEHKKTKKTNGRLGEPTPVHRPDPGAGIASRARVPPQVRCPIFWKPGLHAQKESVPLVTQWASSPSPHCVPLLLQSFSLASGDGDGAHERLENANDLPPAPGFLKPLTRLAADLVRAEVLAVVEEVAAQRGADAPVVGAQELVLLARGDGGRGLCGDAVKGFTSRPNESAGLAGKKSKT